MFAEGQAAVVADAIIARHRGGDAATYDGRGICYLEFGDDQVGKVDVTFVAGQTPAGEFEAPSLDARGRQGRVRRRAHPALVRPRVVERLTVSWCSSGTMAARAASSTGRASGF